MPYIGNIVQDFSVNNAMLNTDSVTSIKIDDGTIVNADINDSAAIAMSKLALSITNSEVNASAAIAGSKISPTFTSAISTSGNEITISGSTPKLNLTDTGNNPDYVIANNDGQFRIRDATSSANRLIIQSDGTVDVQGNLDANGGLDVTGAITGTGDVTITKASDTAKLSLISTGGSGQQFDIRSINSNGRFAIGTASNNHVLFESSNNNVLIADNAGNVGIGTTNPTEKLTTAGNTQIENGHLKIVAASPDIILSVPSGGLDSRIFNDGSGNFIIGHGTNSNTPTERMRIDSAGRVGIGETSPDTLLHIKSADNILATFESTDADALIEFKDNGTSDTILMGALGGDNLVLRCDPGNITFRLGNNSEKARFDSNGNLGIGTSSPGAKLQIATAAVDTDVLRIMRQDNTGISLFRVFQDSSSGGGAGGCHINTSNRDLMISATSNANATDGLYLRTTGRLGIGTSSPQTSLHVNGGDIILSDTNAPNLRVVKDSDSSGSATTNAFFGIASGNNNFFNGAVDNDLCIVAPTNGRILLGFATSLKFRVENDGKIFSAATYNNTTSSSSRSVVMPNNTGEFFASTSSRKFKTNITTLTDALADKILECRPVSFNSLCSADNKTKTFYGLIAEEVHEVDTSLVAYDDENAETPEPTSVQYDRFVPHLINLVKRQKTQIEVLETKVAALEAA